MLLPIKPDYNRTAENDIEASLMIWDLYAYIKGLEFALNECLALKGN